MIRAANYRKFIRPCEFLFKFGLTRIGVLSAEIFEIMVLKNENKLILIRKHVYDTKHACESELEKEFTHDRINL